MSQVQVGAADAGGCQGMYGKQKRLHTLPKVHTALRFEFQRVIIIMPGSRAAQTGLQATGRTKMTSEHDAAYGRA